MAAGAFPAVLARPEGCSVYVPIVPSRAAPFVASRQIILCTWQGVYEVRCIALSSLIICSYSLVFGAIVAAEFT